MKPIHASSAGRGSGADSDLETALHSLNRAVAGGSVDRIARTLEFRRQHRRRRRLVVGAAVACALIGFILVRAPRPMETARVATTRPTMIVVAPATRTLPDGSMVEFKAGAQFDFNFTPTLRRVVLRAGEAHFNVLKDSARPFVVSAGDIEVRAVGTAFAVGFGERAVSVLVTEGRVALARPTAEAAPGGGPHLIDAGSRAVVARNASADEPPQIAPVTVAETNTHLAWRVRRLEFSGTPLAEAVPMFNRHAGSRLALDPALGVLRLSGSLRTDDLDALLLLLRGEFGIASEVQADGTVALRQKPSAVMP